MFGDTPLARNKVSGIIFFIKLCLKDKQWVFLNRKCARCCTKGLCFVESPNNTLA